MKLKFHPIAMIVFVLMGISSTAFAAGEEPIFSVGISESHLILLGLLFIAIVSTAGRKPTQRRIHASLDQTSFS